MASLPEVRMALAETVGNATGVRAYAYAPASPTLPCILPIGIDVSPTTQDYGQQVSLSLWCCVAATHDQFQEKLDAYVLGAGSVTAAIENRPGLGLDDVSAIWTSAGNYSLTQWAGVDMWVAAVGVEVSF